MIIVWGSELAYAGAGRPLIFGGGMSGGSTVTPNTQRGNIDYDQIRGAARAGNGNKFQMLAPSGFVAGHVPEWDADGNIFDSGTTPGGGGITQLTADVTAGPGTGSQAATVVATHLTAPLPVNQGGTGTASTLTGVVRGGSPLTATELSGDVVTSGSNATTIQANAVTTSKINNAAVTLAKIQNATANSKLLGSGASGSGAAYSELTLGTGLSMSGTTVNVTGVPVSPPVVVQETVFTTGSGVNTFTLTLPATAAASGNTLFLILGCDGSGSANISISGWTNDFTQSQTTNSRVQVWHIASAAQTSITMTAAINTNWSGMFFELKGVHALDQSSGAGVANTLIVTTPAITPTAGSIVFSVACWLPASAPAAGYVYSPVVAQWRGFGIPSGGSNGRALGGLAYLGAGAGISLQPPPIIATPLGSLFAGGGVANATFSIL